MALEEAKERLTGSGKPETPKAPDPKPIETDKSAWGGKDRLNVRNWAGSGSVYSETGMFKEEINKISDQVFGKNVSTLKKKDAEKTLKKLEHDLSYAENDAERTRLKKEIKVTKVILGK